MSDEPAKRISWPEMNDTEGAAWRMIADKMATQVATWQASSDQRAIFLDCYLRMTRNMFAAIDAAEFRDAVWVARLLHRFAGYYFAALRAYEGDRLSTSPVWRIAHDAAGDPQTLALQNLFLGVNAHINYDLVFALADLLTPEWDQLTPDQREERFADHCHVNAIIGRTIDTVQNEVVDRYSPLMDLLDKLVGPLDEMIASRLISDWRDEVWQNSMRYMQLTSPDDRDDMRRQVEAATLRRADFILLRHGGDTP